MEFDKISPSLRKRLGLPETATVLVVFSTSDRENVQFALTAAGTSEKQQRWLPKVEAGLNLFTLDLQSVSKSALEGAISALVAPDFGQQEQQMRVNLTAVLPINDSSRWKSKCWSGV